MRSLALTAALFASIAACAGAETSSPQQDAPFDYYGIALDAPLAAVEAARPPGGSWRLVCHADDYFGPQVQNCAYRDRSGRIAPIPFEHTRQRSDDHVFFFAADRVDGTPRLFRIVLSRAAPGRSREAIVAGFRHEVVAGLVARFGAPQEDHSVANSVGFEPGNLDWTTRWRNARSTIEISGPNQSQWELDHTIRVFYEDPDLASHSFELRQQWQNTHPNGAH